MVKRVQELKESIESNRSAHMRLQDDLSFNLAEKAREERRFRDLEQQRKTALAQAQQSSARTQTRLTQIAEDEKRLNTFIESLAAEARGAGGGGTLAGASVFRAGGNLEWPVAGELIYRFGRVAGVNNTQTKENGIGISAPRGTSVRAVAAGRVDFAAERAGYGRIVVLAHPSGDYTVYASLDVIAVQVDASVTKGQILGTVGTSSTNYGPHLHFELRLNNPSAPLQAIDPLPYLRPPRN
jgi:murein DD-endopeptidase MepM/ murein hydrolase activator NlpD